MLLVLLTAPLGLIGVAAILAAFQIPFGFVAMLGVIALFGMIIRNSIILVVQIDQELVRGAPLWSAIVESAVTVNTGCPAATTCPASTSIEVITPARSALSTV